MASVLVRHVAPSVVVLGLAGSLVACGDDNQAATATTVPVVESSATEAPASSTATTSTATASTDTTSDDTAASGDSTAVDERFPEIVDGVATQDGDTWTFDVTVSSPYDSPEQYADGWRVLGPDDEVYGEHTLTHDHATEQPFTRTQSGVTIPDDVDEVTIEGRDLLNGYGGRTMTFTLGR
ncbi:hypothetical protein BH24ACT5_BH24ACT5_03970 [soil metagenome]